MVRICWQSSFASHTFDFPVGGRCDNAIVEVGSDRHVKVAVVNRRERTRRLHARLAYVRRLHKRLSYVVRVDDRVSVAHVAEGIFVWCAVTPTSVCKH